MKDKQHPLLTKAQQKLREQLAPPPLLTKDQLIDWLIYHCPIHESGHNATPFRVAYNPAKSSITGITCSTSYPPWAYDEIAIYIMQFPEVHREITDLYWYWTI